MKLEEASRHLNDCMSETDKILWPECDEAHQLGVEALKVYKAGREGWLRFFSPLLPGETEE